MSELVLGVDPSLTSTGLALINPASGNARVCEVRSSPVGHDLAARAQRQREIVRSIDAWLNVSPSLVVIEAPSFGSRSRSAAQHERSGLFWAIVELVTAKHEARVVEVSPRARAKYATGDGAATKLSVVAATVEAYGRLFAHTSSVKLRLTDNEADALALAAMGARALGQPVERDITEAQLDALKRVDWPNTKGRS